MPAPALGGWCTSGGRGRFHQGPAHRLTQSVCVSGTSHQLGEWNPERFIPAHHQGDTESAPAGLGAFVVWEFYASVLERSHCGIVAEYILSR